MRVPAISATGLWVPDHIVTNDELVASYNSWATGWNEANFADIACGCKTAKPLSSAEFIESASGIKSRYVVDKKGLLDPEIMMPRLRERPNDELSLQAEVAVKAASQALEAAGLTGNDIDVIICSCSNLQRAYPATAIEIQAALGAKGFAFDMNVGCASALFAIKLASDFIRDGTASRALVINPEICTGHMNYRDRDSHFIFGDACTAVLIEESGLVTGPRWDILDTHLVSEYSNNIRNNFGYLNRASPEGVGKPDKLMIQQGRKVFREVVPMVSDMIRSDLARLEFQPGDLKRLWLHQANAKMNRLICQRVLGEDPDQDKAPTVLDTHANTSSAGAIIAFHKHSNGMKDGDLGLLCAFGAGYAAGTAYLRHAA